MVRNWSGIRDTARVLGVSIQKAVDTLKTAPTILNVNPKYSEGNDAAQDVKYDVIMYNQVEDLELGEMWSFVQKKKNQRWLCIAANHDNGDIIAYTFGKRQDKAFLAFQKMLTPLGFRMYYTDGWSRPAEQHIVGKKNTQTIERKNLTLRTRIKRLARKTI